jgi:hypothetical protein
MAETPLVKKLGIKPGYKLLILNAPEGYLTTLGALPEGVEVRTEAKDTVGISGPFDAVQLFAHSKADVDQFAPGAIRAVKSDGLLWISYPKKSSKIKTDIHRDVGWDAVVKAGFEGVSLISVDDTWSAMRFRPASEVKSRRNSND